MNSNIPTTSHGSYDVNHPPRSPHAAAPINTTPIAPRVTTAGELLNNNCDSIAVADTAPRLLLERTPPSASRCFVNLPRLPYLINADDFINARPPRPLYAQGIRDVAHGGSGDDSSLRDGDGSSDEASFIPPVDVFINGERQSPCADRSVDDGSFNVGVAVGDNQQIVDEDINNDAPITAAVIQQARALISSNPLRKMMRLKGWTPAQIAAAREQDNSEVVLNYVVNLADLPFCFNYYHKLFTDCRCLAALDRILLSNITDMLSKFLFVY
jgi:hypothetical protein